MPGMGNHFLMTLIATSWEVEVELVHADFVADEDEARFRAAMARLGFDEGEIDSCLEAMRT